MLIAVSAGSGPVSGGAVRALIAAGHRVRAGVRTRVDAVAMNALGAETVVLGPDRHQPSAALHDLVSGCDGVLSLTGPVPSGRRAALPGAFREHDRLRTAGVAQVVAAALSAGCRLLVQESDTYGYADGGDRWLAEGDPLDITTATEPMAVGEAQAQEFAGPGRSAVVVRLGRVLGDSASTRAHLRAARGHRPLGVGDPDGWVPVLHTDDIGDALCRALHAPTGVYNVAAEPVRRGEVLDAMAEFAGVTEVSYIAGVRRRLAGTRLEPLSRSLRICSEAFEAASGWRATRGHFDASWFDAADRSLVAQSVS